MSKPKRTPAEKRIRVLAKKRENEVLRATALGRPPPVITRPLVNHEGAFVHDNWASEASRLAWDKFQQSDPRTRLEALRLALQASMFRGEAAGAPSTERIMLWELQRLLADIADGNYSDPMLPGPNSGRTTSSRQKILIPRLKHLVLAYQEAYGGTVPEAASECAKAIDKALKKYNTSLAAALPKHGRTASMADRLKGYATRAFSYGSIQDNLDGLLKYRGEDRPQDQTGLTETYRNMLDDVVEQIRLLTPRSYSGDA
jgi:hypothetical protein